MFIESFVQFINPLFHFPFIRQSEQRNVLKLNKSHTKYKMSLPFKSTVRSGRIRLFCSVNIWISGLAGCPSTQNETWIICKRDGPLQRSKNTGNRFSQTEFSCKSCNPLIIVIYWNILPSLHSFIRLSAVSLMAFNHFPLDI